MASDISDTPVYYYLSVNSKDAISEIGINGAPIIKDIEGEGIITAEPVAAWIPNGDNELSIKLSPVKSDNGTLLTPTVKIELFEHDPKFSIPTPKTIIAEYQYPPKESDKKVKLPLTENISFTFRGDTNTKLWKEAGTIKDITADDKNEIIKIINTLETSLVSKDISTAINLQKYKITDDSIAEKKSYKQLENATIKGYEWLNKETGLKALPLTLDNAVFSTCCLDKVVYVSRTNGDDAIQLESDDLYFDIAIFVSKINNLWIIVR